MHLLLTSEPVPSSICICATNRLYWILHSVQTIRILLPHLLIHSSDLVFTTTSNYGMCGRRSSYICQLSSAFGPFETDRELFSITSARIDDLSLVWIFGAIFGCRTQNFFVTARWPSYMVEICSLGDADELPSSDGLYARKKMINLLPKPFPTLLMLIFNLQPRWLPLSIWRNSRVWHVRQDLQSPTAFLFYWCPLV